MVTKPMIEITRHNRDHAAHRVNLTFISFVNLALIRLREPLGRIYKVTGELTALSILCL